MTLGSCRVKTEDSLGAGPQNMFVVLFLMAQYARQSNTKQEEEEEHSHYEREREAFYILCPAY